MASVCNDKSGKRRICFTDGNGGRKTLYLGKAAKKSAGFNPPCSAQAQNSSARRGVPHSH